MRERIEPRNDSRSVDELINAALTEADEEIAWDAVCALHWKGTYEIFEQARMLCLSDCPQERSLGAHILGQLGVEERTYPRESLDLLLRMLEREHDATVLHAVLIALSHKDAPQAISIVSQFAQHPDAEVRYAVVFALTGYTQPEAIDRLIALSRDADSHVRDWATFGLGTQSEADTPEIRNALFERVDDPDFDTRGEAFMGLAQRGDPRVVPALLKALTTDRIGSCAVEAAELIRAPELHFALVGLRDWWDVDLALLERAITACPPI